MKTVAQLIAELETMNQDAIVVTSNRDYCNTYSTAVASVSQEWMKETSTEGTFVENSNGTLDAVIIY